MVVNENNLIPYLANFLTSWLFGSLEAYQDWISETANRLGGHSWLNSFIYSALSNLPYWLTLVCVLIAFSIIGLIIYFFAHLIKAIDTEEKTPTYIENVIENKADKTPRERKNRKWRK